MGDRREEASRERQYSQSTILFLCRSLKVIGSGPNSLSTAYTNSHESVFLLPTSHNVFSICISPWSLNLSLSLLCLCHFFLNSASHLLDYVVIEAPILELKCQRCTQWSKVKKGETQTERKKEREEDRKTERQRKRGTQRKRDREIEREREGHRKREKERDTEKERKGETKKKTEKDRERQRQEQSENVKA